MARYAGRKGRLYLSTSGSGTASAIGSLTSWSLSMTTDKFESTAFGDTNKTYVVGLPDLQGTFEGVYDDTVIATLNSARESTDGVKMYLYPSLDVATQYFYGPVWLDLSMSGSVGGLVTVSGTISANGAFGAKLS